MKMTHHLKKNLPTQNSWMMFWSTKVKWRTSSLTLNQSLSRIWRNVLISVRTATGSVILSRTWTNFSKRSTKTLSNNLMPWLETRTVSTRWWRSMKNLSTKMSSLKLLVWSSNAATLMKASLVKRWLPTRVKKMLIVAIVTTHSFWQRRLNKPIKHTLSHWSKRRLICKFS